MIGTMGGRVPALYKDMLEQTNILIAGRTGAGKSTVMDGLVYTAMKHYFPSEKSFVFVDNKFVTFGKYAKSPFCAFYADTESKFDEALNATYKTCQKRYAEMKKKRLVKYEGHDIYLMIDELPNLIIGHKKRQQTLTQIMNICRACNIHVVVGCQNFLSQCIPTTIKVNFTAICGLQVRNTSDSRVIIGRAGLEDLPAHGTCLYQTPSHNEKVNVEMIDDTLIQEALNYWKKEYAKIKPFKWMRVFFKIAEVWR